MMVGARVVMMRVNGAMAWTMAMERSGVMMMPEHMDLFGVGPVGPHPDMFAVPQRSHSDAAAAGADEPGSAGHVHLVAVMSVGAAGFFVAAGRAQMKRGAAGRVAQLRHLPGERLRLPRRDVLFDAFCGVGGRTRQNHRGDKAKHRQTQRGVVHVKSPGRENR